MRSHNLVEEDLKLRYQGNDDLWSMMFDGRKDSLMVNQAIATEQNHV